MNDSQRAQIWTIEGQMADARAAYEAFLGAQVDVLAEDQRLRTAISVLVDQLGAVYADAEMTL